MGNKRRSMSARQQATGTWCVEAGSTIAHVYTKDAERLAKQFAASGDMLAALLYYRDECSGAEPSISVFHRMLDEALAKAEQPVT